MPEVQGEGKDLRFDTAMFEGAEKDLRFDTAMECIKPKIFCIYSDSRGIIMEILR